MGQDQLPNVGQEQLLSVGLDQSPAGIFLRDYTTSEPEEGGDLEVDIGGDDVGHNNLQPQPLQPPQKPSTRHFGDILFLSK